MPPAVRPRASGRANAQARIEAVGEQDVLIVAVPPMPANRLRLGAARLTAAQNSKRPALASIDALPVSNTNMNTDQRIRPRCHRDSRTGTPCNTDLSLAALAAA